MALLGLIILFPHGIKAQKYFSHKLRSPNIVLESRVYYGWTLDHHLEMTLFKRHHAAYEISLLKATYGRTRWEFMYNYPFIGISYWYSDLGGTRPLGSAHAVFPYINFPLLRTSDFNIYFRLGVGLGYLTRRYDRYDNYENLAIGSHINGAVNLLFEARWRLAKRWMASAGISLAHFSNGAIKQPNYGLNLPGVNLAVGYRLSRENPYLRQKLLPELAPFEFDGKKFLRLDVSAAFGLKDYQATLGKGNRYAVALVSGNLLWPVGYKSHLGFGADISYDGSDMKLLELRGVEVGHNISLVKTGLTVAYELSFSRMSIMLNLGSYVTMLDKSDGYLYEKLGLRVGITDDLFASMTLKAHYARADYIAFGLGYRFNLKYY